MIALSKTIVVLLVLLKLALCANILFISPLPSPSHHLWNKALSMSLIERNHNITMLSHDNERKTVSNFTVITMEGVYEIIRQNFKMEESSHKSVLINIKENYDFAYFLCKHDFATEGLEVLLNYPEDYKFDLIIFDVTINVCLYPLINRFNNPPVVAVTAFLLPPINSNAFGNHLHTSYMPYYGSEFTDEMSLPERTLNFIYTFLEILLRDYYWIPAEFKLAQKRLGQNIASLEKIERNISLLLSNIDPILNYPIALPPNIIPVGGLHVKPAKSLPGDLRVIFGDAKHGVILFTLGTNLRSDRLTVEQRKSFLDAFAKLPQTVLWKFESDGLEGLPKNVIIRKWLPQNDILGHPNTKLFISHCGSLSTQEAMYHGVPVIGMPFFGDQYINIRQMEKKALAKRLDLHKNLSADDVYETIQNLLSTSTYQNNMRRVSKLYRDQPQTAMERAIFWIEYVLRHGGAEHLNIAARDMPVYQTANLDVLAIFALGLSLIFSVLMLLFTGSQYLLAMRR